MGAVVVYADRVLLVHAVQGSGKDQWAIPDGFVERGETVDAAVHRERFEEAGVQADLRGLIAARNRVTVDENSAYFIFVLAAPPCPDHTRWLRDRCSAVFHPGRGSGIARLEPVEQTGHRPCTRGSDAGAHVPASPDDPDE